MPREPVWHEPIHRHTDEYWDQYRARLDVLRARYPFAPASELHHKALPLVEAPAEPSKPAEPKERTMAQRIWPDLP